LVETEELASQFLTIEHALKNHAKVMISQKNHLKIYFELIELEDEKKHIVGAVVRELKTGLDISKL